MYGRENPVTRPSVYRNQDGPPNASVSAVSPPLFSVGCTAHSYPFPFHGRDHQLPAASNGAVDGFATVQHATTSSGSGSAGAGGSVAGLHGQGWHSGSVKTFSIPDLLHIPPRSTAHADTAGAVSTPGGGSGGDGLPRNPSVRTFSQLTTTPVASPTSHFFPAEALLSTHGEPSRGGGAGSGSPQSPLLPPGGVSTFATDGSLHRPVGPDTIREAVYAYLEAHNKHDVVAAMLADERRYAQRRQTENAGGAMAAAASAGGSAGASPPNAFEHPASDVTKVRRKSPDRRGAWDNHTNSGQSLSSQANSRAPSTSDFGSPVPDTFSPVRSVSVGTGSPLASSQGGGNAGAPESKRTRQRRSHELLRKGLWERHSSEHRSRHGTDGGSASTGPSSASPLGSPRFGTSSSACAPRGSPFAAVGAAMDGKASTAGSPLHRPSAAVPTPSPGSHRQHLPQVLPALCGLEEVIQPDLVLLFADLEAKIYEQYRQLRVPPPSHEVLQYILTQSYEPMWSVGEDANAYHLLPPTNPVTGAVLYGTLNQLVEQLTQVYVMPLSTPADTLLKSEQAFCHAFLRRHRVVVPSHVLLAKLMERYLVPLSLRLGFERFKVHGITVHCPGAGASLPPRRSQSETVLHGRRHPGVLHNNSAGDGKQSGRENRNDAAFLRGSRSTVLQPSNQSFGNPTTAVDEYVRTTAAATTPDAALVAIIRAGVFSATAANEAAAVLTNAAVGQPPPGSASSTGNFTDFASPLRGGMGFSAGGGAATGANPLGSAMAGLAGLLGGNAASRPPLELVTTYSKSATLWFVVCERVQLKVLSVLLYWLQHHPHHFDGAMISSILHFVESCCYGPCNWADAPSRQPQIAEFIRQACHNVLALASRRQVATDVTASSAFFAANSGTADKGMSREPSNKSPGGPYAACPPITKEWLDGVLCGTWESQRYQRLWEATPPSLRYGVKPEFLPRTWTSPMGSLTPAEYLPCFAFRSVASADVMLSYPSEDRRQQPPPRLFYSQSMPSPSPPSQGPYYYGNAKGTGRTQSDLRGGAPEVSPLHAAAQEALRSFDSCTFETYVRGLTAAHYRMLIAFPSQDIFVASQYTSSSYLSSPSLQNSFLGCFLNSSVILTSWCVSLLLHAAYLDGERAAAAAVVTNLSILNSFVGSGLVPRVPTVSNTGADSRGSANSASDGASDTSSSSLSMGNTSLSHMSADTASAAAAPSQHDVGNTLAGEDNNSLGGRLSAFLHKPARQFLYMLDRLVDLVVGFLRVNNLHASYSIFRGFGHPFVRKLLHHRRIKTHLHAQTAHRIRRLECFFSSSVPSTPGGAGEADNGTATEAFGHRDGRRDNDAPEGGNGGAAGATTHSASSAAAAAGVGDPTAERGENDSNESGQDGTPHDVAGGTATAANQTDQKPSEKKEAQPRPGRKTHHTFFEYLNTVPDSVEYPTVPVVQYYLRELQMIFALEPSFFTVPSHQMQSRFVSEEVRLNGILLEPYFGAYEGERDQPPTVASPIAVVNWRKLHLVDDWIQRVHNNQMSCLHYISSRSTVVRNIVPDLEFETAFDAQLSCVLVTNTTMLQEMANQLLNNL